MPDYKEMYLHLFRATEQANNIQIEAQRKCEDMYIDAPEHELRVLPKQAGDEAHIRVTSTPDYKEMFQHLFQETHRAVIVLMNAQLECHSMSLDAMGLDLMPLPPERNERLEELIRKAGDLIPKEGGVVILDDDEEEEEKNTINE